MPGLELRKPGTTADRAPNIKRGVATLSDGRVVILAIDANLASSGATDTTGTAKIYLHLSTNSNRTAFTQAIAYTPPVAPCSSTWQAVASMGVGANDSVWVVWQGTDSTLYMSRWTYSAGVFTFVSTTTVQAAGGITNRFRKVDIDVVGNATPVIAAYEGKDSAGNGAWHNLYVLMNDGTTWRRMYQFNALASAPILPFSEDISIAARGDGVVSNVVRFLVWGSRSFTTGDLGDEVMELSFNVSTGVADSATLQGMWYQDLNRYQATGTRRGMIFTLSSTVWILCGVVGTSVPKFFATKLTTGNYSKPAITTVGYVASVALSSYFKIDPSYNQRIAWSATYKDNRLIFGFAGLGSGQSPRVAREIVFSYASSSSVNAAPTVDSVPRPMDANLYGGTVGGLIPGGGVIGIYGGDNKRVAAGLKTFNFSAMYGYPGDTVNSAAPRTWRYIGEDTYDAPFLLSPGLSSGSAANTNFPTFRVKVENLSLSPNLYGKIHVQVSEDPTFTVGNIDIIQSDSALQYFGSKDGLNNSSKQVSIVTPSNQPLPSGVTLYWRARIVSDKDTPGFWSSSYSMVVTHPPVAVPVKPLSQQVAIANGSSEVLFDWNFSDSESTDSQTSYWIIIKRTDTGATIVDTGIVASSNTYAYVVISNTYLDIPLSWSVQLTDTGNEAGAWSTPINFTMSTNPSVLITSPTNLSTVTTAAPVVSWTFTPAGGRAQALYRVRINQAQQANTVANNSFEVDTSGWSTTGCAIARDSGAAHAGTYSAKLTPDGVTANPRMTQTLGTSIALQANVSVTARAWIRPTSATKDVQIGFDWFDLGGVYLSSTVVSYPATALAWQQIEIEAVAPASSARASVRVGLLNTPAAGDIAYVDEVRSFYTIQQVGTIVADSGWVASNASSHAFSDNILEEGLNYAIRVEVKDTSNLSDYDDIEIVTDWIEPAVGNMTLSYDTHKVTIAWDDSTIDANFIGWRVYRRFMVSDIPELDVTNSRNTWIMIYENYEVATDYTYEDYTCPLNKAVDYVVVQLADRFGSVVESNITVYSSLIMEGDRYFFVPEIPVGTIASFEASEIVGDQFTREIEQETLNVVGRGRQVQVGDDRGYIGSLSVHLRNPSSARQVREFFEILSADNNKVYIKSPFGDLILAAIGNIGTNRLAGYGRADIADLTVPYSEVIGDTQVTRISEA